MRTELNNNNQSNNGIHDLRAAEPMIDELANIHTPQDAFEVASSSSPIRNPVKYRHYEAQISPKSQMHHAFLIKCAGYEGTVDHGQVSANLDPKFWSWLKNIDTNVILQSYVDAATLSGEAPTKIVDNETLLNESGISNDFSPEDIAKINSERKAALLSLQVLHATNSRKPSLLSNHVAKRLRLEYAASTDGGDLKHDYQVYCRSLKFRDQLLAAASLSMAAMSQNSVQNIIFGDRKHEQAMVIALMRLEFTRLKGAIAH